MYAAARNVLILLAILPTVYALGPAGAEANVFSTFISDSWNTLTSASGQPYWYGIGAALAIILFAILARLPAEGFAIAAILAVIIVSSVIPIVGLLAALVFGGIVGIALLRIFTAR